MEETAAPRHAGLVRLPFRLWHQANPTQKRAIGHSPVSPAEELSAKSAAPPTKAEDASRAPYSARLK